MSMIVYFLICIFIVFYWRKEYICYQKVKELFKVTDLINLETIILFSHKELAKRIMRILKKTNKSIRVQVTDNSYLLIPSNISKDELLSKIDLTQILMIQKRYDDKNEVLVKEYVDKLIFDIWLDYGYRRNYRDILKREIRNLLSNNEISVSTYNEIYSRVFLFERNKYNKGEINNL